MWPPPASSGKGTSTSTTGCDIRWLAFMNLFFYFFNARSKVLKTYSVTFVLPEKKQKAANTFSSVDAFTSCYCDSAQNINCANFHIHECINEARNESIEGLDQLLK